jgi:hypothetical protein
MGIKCAIFIDDLPRMLPTKFWFIWPSGFRGDNFLEINQSETRIACGGHVCQQIGKNREKASEMQQPSCKSNSFGQTGFLFSRFINVMCQVWGHPHPLPKVFLRITHISETILSILTKLCPNVPCMILFQSYVRYVWGPKRGPKMINYFNI